MADVFVFWLAVMASFESLLTSQRLGHDLQACDKETIRKILNFRFKQMILNNPSDIFVPGFVLHPSEF